MSLLNACTVILLMFFCLLVAGEGWFWQILTLSPVKLSASASLELIFPCLAVLLTNVYQILVR